MEKTGSEHKKMSFSMASQGSRRGSKGYAGALRTRSRCLGHLWIYAALYTDLRSEGPGYI